MEMGTMTVLLSATETKTASGTETEWTTGMDWMTGMVTGCRRCLHTRSGVTNASARQPELQ